MRGRGAKTFAVERQRLGHQIGREVRRERERQAQEPCELRAVEARAEQPNGNVAAGTGHGADRLPRHLRLEVAQELGDVLGKRVPGRLLSAA